MARPTQVVGGALAEALPNTRKHWFQQPHLLKLNLILLIPILSSTTVGYDGGFSFPRQGLTNNEQASLMTSLQSFVQWKEYFSHPTGALLGTIIAAQPIGSLIAIPFSSDLCDRLGRKPVLLYGIIMTCSGAAIQGTSINVGMLIFARILIGFGGMFSSQPSPMLIAELAYPTHRGKYTSAYWTLFYLGSVLASWFTFGCQDIASSWSWRIPSLLQAACPAIQLLFLWWVPESPRWLVAQGRIDEASAILKRHRDGQANAATPPSELVTLELAEITNAIKLEKDAQRTGWTALLATPGNRKRTILTICIGVFSIWNGVTMVIMYLPLVLNSVGVTSAYTQTLINGLLQVFNLLAALTGAFLVDRLGRRALFLWSSTGMLISYIIWTACAAVNSETGSQPAGIAVIACMFILLFHSDIAWSPLFLGYPTEIFPYSLRAKGLAVDMVAMYGSLVITAYCHPIGLEDLGWRYYIVFCAFMVGILGTVYFYFPETRGFTLEEIRVIFDGDEEERAPATLGTTRLLETA